MEIFFGLDNNRNSIICDVLHEIIVDKEKEISSVGSKGLILCVNVLLHVVCISCSMYIVRQINELRREGGREEKGKANEI